MYYTPIIKILPNFHDLVNGDNAQNHLYSNNNYIQSFKYTNIKANFLSGEVIRSLFCESNPPIKSSEN